MPPRRDVLNSSRIVASSFAPSLVSVFALPPPPVRGSVNRLNSLEEKLNQRCLRINQ